MLRILSLTCIVLAMFISNADARYRHKASRTVLTPEWAWAGPTTVFGPPLERTENAFSGRKYRHRGEFSRFSDGIGPRPGKVCGWLMQHDTGVTSRSTGLNLNLARNWRYVGSPGNGSAGEIFSQYGHVSRIVGPGRRPGYVKTVSKRRNGGVYYVDRRLSSGYARRL